MRRNLDGMRRKRKIGCRIELARFLEVPRQTITDLLNGRQNPTGEQILAMQELLEKRH
jgi:plasmid maintenance system antidote protein VapI